MKRTAMARAAPSKRTAEQGGDEVYLMFIRSLPCCICQRSGPSHPHHATGLGRGKGQKAPDNQTMPLCFIHHRQFHDLSGYFGDWSRDQKTLWQELQIERCQEAWRAFVSTARYEQLCKA